MAMMMEVEIFSFMFNTMICLLRVYIPVGIAFQYICSYVLFPFAMVMGVDIEDCRHVAELIGIKSFINEFVAYDRLTVYIHNKVGSHIV